MKNTEVYYHKFFSLLNWLVLFLIISLFFSLFYHNLVAFNQDLGRHLKLGEIIWQQKKVLKTNYFSFTFPQFSFINHHWLAEVIFFLFSKNFGINSLIILKIIVNFLAFFLLLFFTITNLSWLISLGWGFLLLLLFSQRTEVRPEIFSYLFFSLNLIILSSQSIFKKYFYVLPIIQLFWVNTHIYFPLGPALLFFYLLNHLIIFKLKRKKELIKILVVFFLTLLVCFLNPNFIRGALYPFFVFKNYGHRVVENQSLFFLSHYYGKIYLPYFWFIFLIALLSFLITLNKQNFQNLAYFSFFSLLGVMAIRNIPIFVLAIFLPVAKNFYLLKEKILGRLKPDLILNLKLLSYFSFIFLLLFLTYQNVSGQTYRQTLSDKRFQLGSVKGAQDGVKFILNNKLAGPMFNNFDIGSFLIYRLFPQYQVFVDGRPEAYPADFFKKVYIPMQESQEKWQEVDKQYHFNFIFFSHTDITPWAIKFLQRISKDKDWQLVFLDDYVIIFLKKNQINEEVIRNFSLEEKNFNFSCQKQVDCLARMVRILNILGWQKASLTL